MHAAFHIYSLFLPENLTSVNYKLLICLKNIDIKIFYILMIKENVKKVTITQFKTCTYIERSKYK